MAHKRTMEEASLEHSLVLAKRLKREEGEEVEVVYPRADLVPLIKQFHSTARGELALLQRQGLSYDDAFDSLLRSLSSLRQTLPSLPVPAHVSRRLDLCRLPPHLVRCSKILREEILSLQRKGLPSKAILEELTRRARSSSSFSPLSSSSPSSRPKPAGPSAPSAPPRSDPSLPSIPAKRPLSFSRSRGLSFPSLFLLCSFWTHTDRERTISEEGPESDGDNNRDSDREGDREGDSDSEGEGSPPRKRFRVERATSP